MHLWIVTIGSSDVQLYSDKTNHEKGRIEKQRSDKIWNYWYTDELKAECHDIDFVPQPPFKDKDETYRIAPRILGMIYNSSSEQVQQEIWNYLTFPLLDNFVQTLATYPAPEAIAVLLTDQSAVFSDAQRRKPKIPYWQDTHELKPILQRYFAAKFPSIPCEWLLLQAETQERSLDNWDAVLGCVREKFRDLKIADQAIQLASTDNVYVSHQAGTPAISSAVQFCSLEKFGDHVKFLVSNEYNQNLTGILPSSNYLIALKRQQAEKLLEWHDYSAVKEVFSSYLSDEENILLDAAIQWNFAKFDDFANELERLPEKFSDLVQEVEERRKCWWWEAYEAAYLAFIRLRQENAVEAFFHSFRAVEGLISRWAEVHYSEHIDPNNDSPRLKASILKDSALNYFGKSKYKEHKEELESKQFIVLSGFPLYTLLRAAKPNWKKDCVEITEFIEKIAPTRNKIFHRLRGLKADDVSKAWLVNDADMLETKILKYLDFVSDQRFTSLEDASLMAQVHRELKESLANL